MVHASSHIGRVRDRNEDAFLIGDLDSGDPWEGGAELTCEGARGPFAVVCDGMGGAAGGEVASDLAVRTTWREMREAHATDDPEVFARILRRAVRAANQRVHDESEREPTLRGMGTTLSAAGVAGHHLVLAQVGDSRVYLHRAGVLTQVTRDQTLAQALVNAGRMSEAEAEASVGAATILQALGVGPDVEPSLSLVALRQGDRVLLCSDGLYNQLGPSTIQAIVDGRRGPSALAQALCDAACAAGGHDNITAVVMFLDGDALPAPASTDEAPRFVEFDPREEGERALTSTSYVARRLAARAGVGNDPGPPVLPATGQHAIIPRGRLAPGVSMTDLAGPASRQISASRTHLLWLVVAVVIAAAIGWWLAGH